MINNNRVLSGPMCVTSGANHGRQFSQRAVGSKRSAGTGNCSDLGDRIASSVSQLLVRCVLILALLACLADDRGNGALAMPPTSVTTPAVGSTVFADFSAATSPAAVSTTPLRCDTDSDAAASAATVGTSSVAETGMSLTTVGATSSSPEMPNNTTTTPTPTQHVEPSATESLDYNANGINVTAATEDDRTSVNSGAATGDEEQPENEEDAENDEDSSNARDPSIYGDGDNYLDTYDDDVDKDDVDLEKDEEDD